MTLELMDLVPDIIFKLLREYLTMEDKFKSLMDMPEFRPYLQQRAAWITSCPYVSLPFLDLMRTIPRGWYVHRKNSSHRLWLLVDPNHMILSFHHFYLDRFLFQQPTSICTFRSPFEKMPSLFRAFMKDYVFLPHMKRSLYDLKHYGLLILQSEDPCKIRFHDGEEYTFTYYQPIRMKDTSGVYHFKVMLMDDHTLRVECLLTTGHCLCEQRRVELLPVCWQVEKSGHQLKTTVNTCIQVAGVQRFQMVDTDEMQGTMTYFLADPHPDMQVEVKGAHNKRQSFLNKEERVKKLN